MDINRHALDRSCTITINSENYEARVLLNTWLEDLEDTESVWTGEVYCRHGGKGFPSWWYQQRGDSIAKHARDSRFQLQEGRCVLVFVKEELMDINSIKTEFLRYIGGQTHAYCSKHRLPLISSTTRDLRCKFGAIERYQCCDATCKTCICIKCLNQLNKREISYISPPDHDIQRRNSHDFFDYDEEGDDNDIFQMNRNNVFEGDVFDSEGLENYLTITDEPDSANYFGDDSDYHEYIPTTNPADMELEIREEVSTNNEGAQVSGHVLLNQWGSCCSRRKFNIKGSSKHHNFTQRMCATWPGGCVPLGQEDVCQCYILRQWHIHLFSIQEQMNMDL